MRIRDRLVELLNPLIYRDGIALVPGRLHGQWPERQALRRLLARLRIDCVLDVGANVGQFGLELRALGYSGTILSFEPNPDCFRILKEIASRDGNWAAHQIALGSSPARLPLNIMRSSDFSSFLRPGGETDVYYPEANFVTHTVEVEVETLNNIFSSLVGSRFFLKMDTQGFDLEVFRGASQVLRHIHGLQSEVSMKHLYDRTPPWHEVIQEYRHSGFGLTAMYPVHPEVHDEVLEFNCHFQNLGRNNEGGEGALVATAV